MGRIDRLVLWAIGGMSFMALSAAGLVYANDWWLSGLVTVSILCWLAGVLAAIYSRPQQRPALVGAVLVSLLYVTLALGPWFRVQVSPWLLTSQALVHVETKWLGRQPQPPQQAPQVWTSYPVLLDSGTINLTSTITTPTSLITAPAMPAGGSSPFVAVGHWLCAWLAAGAGAIAAGRISRRSRVVQPQASERAP